MDNEFEQMKLRIKNELVTNIALWDKKQKKHATFSTSFAIGSILLSAAIAIVGMFNFGIAAAILAIVLSAVLAIQQVFPFMEMSYFYRVGVAEGKSRQLRLETKANTKPEVEKLVEEVETLILEMAKDIPRGMALHDAIQTMRERIE